jgi:phosphohistidine phosphatase
MLIAAAHHMTSLFLLRHAKAISAEPGMRDFDRPLHRRGKEECAFIGREMQARGILPTHVLCSASKRTRETLEFVMLGARMDPVITYSERLYSAGAEGYFELMRAFGSAESLMVVGHNPSTEELAIQLAARGDRATMDALMRGFPTGALAHFDFDGPLSNLESGKAMLSAFILPPRD